MLLSRSHAVGCQKPCSECNGVEALGLNTYTTEKCLEKFPWMTLTRLITPRVPIPILSSMSFVPWLLCLCHHFVLICVYICLVRPLNKQRRRMFRACTASSAAFIATSYMPHMQQGIEAVSQSPKVNTTLVPQKAKEDPKVTIVTIKAPKTQDEDEEDLDFWHTRRLQPPSTQPSTSTSNTSPNLLKNSHLTPIIDHVNNETSNTSASSWSVNLWRSKETRVNYLLYHQSHK